MPDYSKLFDRRTVGRYMDKGLVKQKEYDQHLKALPDEEANAQWVQMDLHDAEISGDDSGSDDADSDEDSDIDEVDSDQEGT